MGCVGDDVIEGDGLTKAELDVTWLYNDEHSSNGCLSLQHCLIYLLIATAHC